MTKISDRIIEDSCALSPSTLQMRPHAHSLGVQDVLPILASPDSGKPLSFNGMDDGLSDGEFSYPMRGGLPLLVPYKLQPYFSDHLDVPFDVGTDSFLQYFLLASIKQSGVINAINADFADMHFQRHLYRMHDFLKGANGIVLDVGCDDPEVGASLLPESASYVGLDPFCRRSDPFRVIGVGEYLPFGGETVNGVVFNTSLDHILDWRQALQEADRVLTPGGKLYISTLVWIDRAGLTTDSVHFHHFREYEIFGALSGYVIADVRRYAYKNDHHRYGVYLSAEKPVV